MGRGPGRCRTLAVGPVSSRMHADGDVRERLNRAVSKSRTNTNDTIPSCYK
jgi:hypothetical protein